eukprot:evm.model.NODE_4096_length_4686_cov_43.297482.1
MPVLFGFGRLSPLFFRPSFKHRPGASIASFHLLPLRASLAPKPVQPTHARLFLSLSLLLPRPIRGCQVLVRPHSHPTHPCPPFSHPNQEEEESKPDPLKEALEAAEEQAQTHPAQAIAAFHAVLHTPNRDDEVAQRIKEEAIYRLAKLHADAHGFREVMALLKESNDYFALVPKAKTAKI